MIEQPITTGPLEATLPRDITVNSGRLIATRWVAGVMVLVATAFCVRVLRLPLPEGYLYLTGLFILAYNGVLTWRTQRADTADIPLYLERIRRLVVWQVALDWLSMALFLHFTGGITSPAILFFFLHTLMVTILLPGQSPYIYAGLAVGVVVAIALLERMGMLAHYTIIPGLPADLYTNGLYVLAQILFFAVALFATVYLTTSIMARLRERDRQIAALFQTTLAVSSTLDLESVLSRLARSAAQALSVPGASIRLLDEDGGRLTMTASYGLSEEYLDKGPIRLSESEIDRKVFAGQVLNIPDTAAESRFQYPEKIAAEGIRSMLIAPIMGRDRPLGLLRAYADQPAYFDEEDVDFLTAIARQGATALENALAHDALQRADQEREQFVRIVTHELRSPVTGAQSLLGVLLRNLAGELSEKQRDILSRLDARMEKLLALINDLLAFAASKSVGTHAQLTRVAVQPAVEAVMKRFRPQAEEKDIALSLESADGDLAVCATEEGVVRILDNLIGNAVKYTPEGGRVGVHIERTPDHAVITVTDTGIGIPQETLDRIGEEFFRASNAKEAGIVGTGLGMAIVKQLIDRFDGTMRVESEEDEGTTFTVTLPRH